MGTAKNLDARRRAVRVAEDQDGVLTRADAARLGMDAQAIRKERAQGRVVVDGRAIRVVGQQLSERGEWRRLLSNSSPDCALDGLTALRFFGLENFDDGQVHVSAARGAKVRRRRDSCVHVLRCWDPVDVVQLDGLRLVVPEIAAVRAARWAISDRAAATVLAMSVQQRLIRAEDLRQPAASLPRHRRNSFIRALVDEIAGGCEALGEIDFARECRRRGLPEPVRQQVLKRPGGRWFLDVRWPEFGVVVEVDGVQHQLPERATSDALKQNESTLRDDRVLKFTTLAVRTGADEFYEQLARALRAGGWTD